MEAKTTKDLLTNESLFSSPGAPYDNEVSDKNRFGDYSGSGNFSRDSHSSRIGTTGENRQAGDHRYDESMVSSDHENSATKLRSPSSSSIGSQGDEFVEHRDMVHISYHSSDTPQSHQPRTGSHHQDPTSSTATDHHGANGFNNFLPQDSEQGSYDYQQALPPRSRYQQENGCSWTTHGEHHSNVNANTGAAYTPPGAPSTSYAPQVPGPPPVVMAITPHPTQEYYNPAPMPTYPYSHYPPHYVQHHPHFYSHMPPYMIPPPPPPVEYIRNIKPKDVLCGRGGATNSHSGNRAFRDLVKSHQHRYLKAKKKDKPDVADYIVKLIRNQGGRFLRRCEALPGNGEILWVDVGDAKANEKTCQALREGAPKLRRLKRKHTKDEDLNLKRSETEDTLSSTSSGERNRTTVTYPHGKLSLSDDTYLGSDESQGSIYHRNSDAKNVPRYTFYDDTDHKPSLTSSEKMVIQPFERLIKHSQNTVAVNELTSRDQELYLRDFLPPESFCSTSQSSKSRVITPNANYHSVQDEDEDEVSLVEV